MLWALKSIQARLAAKQTGKYCQVEQLIQYRLDRQEQAEFTSEGGQAVQPKMAIRFHDELAREQWVWPS